VIRVESDNSISIFRVGSLEKKRSPNRERSKVKVLPNPPNYGLVPDESGTAFVRMYTVKFRTYPPSPLTLARFKVVARLGTT